MAKSLPATLLFLSYNIIFANVVAAEFHVTVNCDQLPQAIELGALITPTETPLIVASIEAALEAESD